jgi:hypothetical protein
MDSGKILSIDYRLCYQFVYFNRNYFNDDIPKLLTKYVEAVDASNHHVQTIRELKKSIVILEAENRLLKESVS